MKSLTICLENCDEIISDSRRRILTSEANKFAEGGAPLRCRWRHPRTIWESVVIEHERLYWEAAYRRRQARIKRMLEAQANGHYQPAGKRDKKGRAA